MQQRSIDVLEVAARQHGLVTRADLARLGVTPRQRRTLLSIGVLEPLGRQVLRSRGAPATPHQRILAGCLEVGGWASHRSGVWLHGIGVGPIEGMPQVTVRRHGSDYRPELAEVHSTTWLPDTDVTEVDGIPCLSVARTLFSLAAITPRTRLDPLRDVVDEAVRDRKASDAWLWHSLEKLRRRGRPGVRRFEAVLAERAGGLATESWLEREFLAIVRASGLPLPVCQERIRRDGAFVARVDFLYRALGVVVEVSGHVHHSTREQQSADAARRTRLAAAGLLVVEFTYDDIVRRPDRVVGVIRDLHVRGRPRGRPAA